MDRNLDGVYFRIERDGKWQSICFSDLNEEEMNAILTGMDNQALKKMCMILGKRIRKVGDELGLSMEQ